MSRHSIGRMYLPKIKQRGIIDAASTFQPKVIGIVRCGFVFQCVLFISSDRIDFRWVRVHSKRIETQTQWQSQYNISHRLKHTNCEPIVRTANNSWIVFLHSDDDDDITTRWPGLQIAATKFSCSLFLVRSSPGLYLTNVRTSSHAMRFVGVAVVVSLGWLRESRV